MKKKLLLLLLTASAFTYTAKAQDTVKTTADAPLVVYGSVDTYYKDDFSGHSNINTSFASDNNSISIGMIDLGLKKTVGNASFVGELSFGPRSDQSIPTSGYHIQNLYVSYNLTPKLSATAGYMSTYIGYEVISPTGNFNYSTSYLFTAGPFQNAGFKLTYAFSDKVSLMAGIFNDQWNAYTSEHDVSTFGAQLTVTPVKNWTAYLNLATGPTSGTIFDLTTAYQITTAFKLGLNGADFTPAHGGGGYDGVALYPQVAVSKAVTLGLRGEYFNSKSIDGNPSEHVSEVTLTANIKAGPLTFIPEVRVDSFGDKSYSSFTDSNLQPTKSASQFVLAAVYAF
ncbi:outer membrane beta-barrel protein [Mucilaginibacter sp.]